MEENIKKLAHFEVELINRIWRCMEDEEENFEAICRRLIDNGDKAELRRFMCRASTGFLLAVAFLRFKTAMKPRLSQKELGEAFIQMVNDKAKNVTDHWRNPPKGTFE
ncbi:MAG: hypothetical protein WCF20_10540 [Methylovirgula sp.]